jgi:hypothetical protein
LGEVCFSWSPLAWFLIIIFQLRCFSCRLGLQWLSSELACIALWQTLPPGPPTCTTFSVRLLLPAHSGRCSFSAPGNLQNKPFPAQETKQINAASHPINRMEVAVHIVSEQQVTPRINDDDLLVSLDEQMHRELSGLRCDDKV